MLAKLLHPISNCVEAPLYALICATTQENNVWRRVKNPTEFDKRVLADQMADEWDVQYCKAAEKVLLENNSSEFVTWQTWDVLRGILNLDTSIAVLHYNNHVEKWFTYYSTHTDNPTQLSTEDDEDTVWLMKSTDGKALYIVKNKERLVDALGYCPYCTGVETKKRPSKNIECQHRTKKELKRINKNKKRRTGLYMDELGSVVDETTHIIHNEDNLCGPRAVVVGMEYAKYSAGRPNNFDRVRNDVAYQTAEVESLLLNTNTTTEEINAAGGMRPEDTDLGLLSAASGCYIRVYMKSNKYSLIYSSPPPERSRVELDSQQGGLLSVEDYDRKQGAKYHRPMQKAPDNATFIYLLYDGKHYDTVLMPKKLFQPDFVGKWCHWCSRSVVYGDSNTHQCMRNCQVCNDDDCPTDVMEWETCVDCNKMVKNETCMRMHKVNNRCTRLTKCTKCLKRIKVNAGRDHRVTKPSEVAERVANHVCGEKWCPACKEYLHPTHRDEGKCFIQKEEPKTTPLDKQRNNDPKYIFFDFETHTSQGSSDMVPGTKYVHTVDWAEAQYWNGERKTFTTLDSFCEWIFNFNLHDKYTVIAHNGKGYDFIFIQKWFATYGVAKRFTNIRTIKQGSKVITLQVSLGRKTIRFVDSINFFISSLSKLPKSFNLKLEPHVVEAVSRSSIVVDIPGSKDTNVCSKGFFPYLFSNPANAGYEGPVPDKKWFGMVDLKRASVDEKKVIVKFNKWWQHLRDTEFVWNLANELEDYCRVDVEILRLACRRFREIMMELSDGIDPFQKVTIASYVMQVYINRFMPENSIALYTSEMSAFFRRGLFGGRTNGIKMFFNGEGKRKAEYTDVVSLYPYCQHGKRYPIGVPEDIKNPSQDIKDYQRDTWLFMVELDITPPPDLYIPVLPEKKVDTTSVRTTNARGEEVVRTTKGSVKLMFDLLPKTNYVTNSVELSVALEKGYVITKIHRVMLWKETTLTLFRDYVNTFYKIKTENGGWPKHLKGAGEEEKVEWLQQIKEEVGVDIDETKIVKNPGYKSVAKLCLNSLWGKFCQKENQQKTRWIKSMEELNDFKKKVPIYDESGENLLNKVQPMVKLSEEVAFVSWRSVKDEDTDYSSFISPPIGVFTTAHARMVLYGALEKLDHRVLYFDTDSVIFYCEEDETVDGLMGDMCGVVLGKWESELDPGTHIDEMGCLGPKTYFYRVVNEEGKIVKYDTRAKGFTMKKMAAEDSYMLQKKLVVDKVSTHCKIDLPELKDYIKKMFEKEEKTEQSIVKYPTTLFTRDEYHTITTKQVSKGLKVTAKKRSWPTNLANPNLVDSLPIGYTNQNE